MPETPHKVTLKINSAIQHLNTTWNLHLPDYLHGQEAKNAGEEADKARKCYSRIRHFCWKGNVSIDRIIEEFEELAKQKFSEWRYKPQQASGTLLSLPKTKSWLRRDAVSKAKLDHARRFELIDILLRLLEDEFNLCKDSDGAYTRTSFTSNSTGIESNSTSFTSVKSGSSRTSFATAPEPDQPMTVTNAPLMAKNTRAISSKKRGSANTTTAQSPKRAKTEAETNSRNTRGKQLTLTQEYCGFIIKPEPTISNFTNGDQQPPPSSIPLERSFDTVESDGSDPIFSDIEPGVTSSNETSVLSDVGGPSGRESVFSGGTQLDNEILNNPSFNRSYNTAVSNSFSQSRRAQLENIVRENPMQACPPAKVDAEPFWLAYELHRLSRHLQCDIDTLYKSFTDNDTLNDQRFERVWSAMKRMCQDMGVKLPAKSNLSSKMWITEENSYIDEDLAISVYFSARLDFSEQKGQLFELTLNPIETDKSCRFHRKFGADRFLVLDMPCTSPQFHKDTPSELRDSGYSPEDIHQKMMNWLGNEHLHIAGRQWRVFYIEPKDVPKKKRKEEGTRMKAHLFAVNGSGFKSPSSSCRRAQHTPVSLLDLIQWHTPLKPNSISTDLKLFARLHLGLSKTTPTIVLEQSEFIHIQDKMPTKRELQNPLPDEIMTDGNARISYPMAQAIWKLIGNLKDPIPSVFQARIGGAKGTWTVDYNKSYPNVSNRGFWIEISDSQLKIRPHPREITNADPCQRTFEVVKFSKPCVPANLNIQLMTILNHGRVSRKVLADLLLAALLEYYQELTRSLNDPVTLRIWRHSYHSARSIVSDISWCGEMPDSKEDELDMLLENAFHPQECPYVKECVYHLLKQVFQDQKDKLWIKVPFSTNAFCIPDPLGVLKEGEIQFNFSQPVSEFPEWELEDRTILVARNPAHLESDIQAVKYVYRSELRHIKDVVIMSIEGFRSLAGMLSGGDYDGDTVTAIWDERITAQFKNAKVPQLPSKAECKVVTKTKYIKDIFNIKAPTRIQLNDYISRCLWFNGMSSRLGEVTKLFEKLVYADKRNMTSPDALELAALAGYLVDGAKAGDTFTTQAWWELQGRITSKYRLPEGKPAYATEVTSQHKILTAEGLMCTNVLDYLKFDVAAERAERILAEYHQNYLPNTNRDPDLIRPWKDALRIAESAQGDERSTSKAMLKDLERSVRKVAGKWSQGMRRNEGIETRKGATKDLVQNDYKKLSGELAVEIAEIVPLEKPCYIYTRFQREGGQRGTFWSQLRASCMYYMFHEINNKMIWRLVGDELCWIKSSAARARGERVRGVHEGSRNYMRMDPKKFKAAREVLEMNEEKEFGLLS